MSRERRPSTRGVPHGSASRPPDQAGALFERSEFAHAPAARAAEPMRVARAEEAPWDALPARDSCGTMKWTANGPSSPVPPVPPVPNLSADQTATVVTWTSRPSPFTAFETMQYFSASWRVFATSASRSARSADGTWAARSIRVTR